MPRDQYSQAQRLFLISALLREQTSTVKQIAQHLYPDIGPYTDEWKNIERALQRDLLALKQLEPCFRKIEKRPPRYVIDTQRTTLSPTQLLIFHAAARLTYHRAAGQATSHREALDRLSGWLPLHLQPVVRRSYADVGQKRRSDEDLNFELAATAWVERHPLRFTYRKPNGSGQLRSNTLEIYLIETDPTNLDLYAIGRESSFHDKIRTFKLSRMKHMQILRDQEYDIPESFQPRAFLKSAWGIVGAQGQGVEQIRLRFRADAAYRILEGGYPNLGEPQINGDGSIETVLAAPLDGSGLPREVLPWIYSFGPRVEVLGPAHIRKHWLGELREATAQASVGDAQVWEGRA